jgi:FkbM family methyltransferase
MDRIVSFEPVSSTFAKLQAASTSEPTWSAHNFALGDRPGRATINVSKDDHLSSFLSMSKFAHDTRLQIETARTETVDIKTLDEIYSEFESNRVFLKIDTQGFEKQVLDGGKESLSKILGVQLEIPVYSLYEHNWSFDEAIAYMKGAGFTVSQIHAVPHYERQLADVLDVDCIFRRAAMD